MTDQKVVKGNTRTITFVKAFLPRTQIKFVVGGMVIATLMAYDGHSGNFAALRLGDVILGGVSGLGVSMAMDGANGAIRLLSEGRARRMKGWAPFRSPAPRSRGRVARRPTQSARTVQMDDGRRLPLNQGRDSFEYQLTQSQGRMITIRTKLDLAKALVGWPIRERPLPPPSLRPRSQPTKVAEVKFESYDLNGQRVQLLESDVIRFLRIAWRNNARGSGLSLNRWTGKRFRLPEWYVGKGIGWYWATLNMMADAEEITGTQLVRVVVVNRSRGIAYLVMLLDERRTYEVLLSAITD